MRLVESLADALTLSGSGLGTGDWMEVPQQRIDLPGATRSPPGDPRRLGVRRAGTFGTTIAHGYLTLALIVPLRWELVSFPDGAM